MTIIDSCIIVDITENGPFTEKSQAALAERANAGRLFAPDVVFAEICYSYQSLRQVNAIFEGLGIEVVSLQAEALFRAAKAFKKFDDRKKHLAASEPMAKRIIADFYVGALAENEGVPLLTRDAKRKWKLHFPDLVLIQP